MKKRNIDFNSIEVNIWDGRGTPVFKWKRRQNNIADLKKIMKKKGIEI